MLHHLLARVKRQNKKGERKGEKVRVKLFGMVVKDTFSLSLFPFSSLICCAGFHDRVADWIKSRQLNGQLSLEFYFA